MIQLSPHTWIEEIYLLFLTYLGIHVHLELILALLCKEKRASCLESWHEPCVVLV